jgi:hypothetical protein
MDSAYDHIQEEFIGPEEKEAAQGQQPGNLSTDLREAYKSFSTSPWAAKLGVLWGSVKKQGETYYHGVRDEATAVGEEAFKGLTDLRSSIVSRARALSHSAPSSPRKTSAEKDPASVAEEDEVDPETKATLRESESILARLRIEGAKRLKEIQKAEDAADEALLKFGTNIRNFLRDAVTIAPPDVSASGDGDGKVLFESKDSEGKRVIHTTRFDAQLHVIHCSLDSFTKDPASPEYEKWKTSDFDVAKKTDDISADLEKYDELRRAMEKLVPERVEYEQFWRRYYFLRMVVESEERRRREMLRGIPVSQPQPVTAF